MQGLTLKSSDRGPIRVQFSKTPFGRKREAIQGNNIGMMGSMGNGGSMGAGAGAVPTQGSEAAAVMPSGYTPAEYKPDSS